MSEIRLDKIHNKYVIIAPERLHRPNIMLHNNKERSTSICPFCEGNEALTPKEVFAIRENEANAPFWKTRVIPNLYKAVQIELENSSQIDGMFESIAGVGAHEILIDSPGHNCNIKDLKEEGIENWLRTIIIRTEDLTKDRRFIHLNVFKNYGSRAGATQEHPHTQIIALPIMPQSELNFLDRNMKYYKRHGRGLIEDIVFNEQQAKTRVISQSGSFIAYCPYASSFPFEVMIAPTKPISNLSKCGRSEVTNLSYLLKNIFEMLQQQLGDFEYNLSFQLPPLNTNFENQEYMNSIEQNYRFTIRITPRIYNFGGFEISTNMMINSVSPEECAKLLRGD